MLESLTGATRGVWSKGPSQTPAAPDNRERTRTVSGLQLEASCKECVLRAQLWEKCPGGKRAPQPSGWKMEPQARW